MAIKSIRYTRMKVLTIGVVIFGFLYFVNVGHAKIRTYYDKNGVLHMVGVGKQKQKKKTQLGKVSKRNYISNPQERRELAEYIKIQCSKYGIDSALVKAIVKVESDFNPYSVSSAGAVGIMQLMPGTAQRFNVKDIFDPYQNITGGIKYLRYLHRLFRKDIKLVLAAYNAGENAVIKHRGIPPYKETREYVKNVLSLYKSGFYQGTKKSSNRIYSYVNDKGIIVITTKKPRKR